MNRKILTIIFILLFTVLIAMTLAKPLAQDEGVFLTIAKGIANYQLPYRDFFDHKPAGIYFALVPLIKLFGCSVLAPKILLLLVNLATIIFAFLISEKMKISGLISSIFITFGMIFFESNFIIAEPFVVLLLALSAYLALNAKIPKNYVYVGVAIGVAILFKQTATINLLAVLVVLLLSRKWQSSLYTVVGAAVAIFLFVVYLWQNNLAGLAYDQIILANISSYPREPFTQVIRNLLPSFLATVPLWIFATIGGLKYWRKIPKLILLFALLPIPFFLIRHYPHYWLQVMPFVAILASYSFAKITLKLRWMLLASIILISIIPISRLGQNFILLREQIAISNYISKQNERYLLAENQASPYHYLTDKIPLNKYLYITEVNDWRENSERSTISDLEHNQDVLVVWPSDPDFAYAKRLQKYILDNFRVVKEYEDLRIEMIKE